MKAIVLDDTGPRQNSNTKTGKTLNLSRETPPAIERPKLVAPQEQAKTPVTADKPEIAVKPKKKRVSTEARIIHELHRHGIYW